MKIYKEHTTMHSKTDSFYIEGVMNSMFKFVYHDQVIHFFRFLYMGEFNKYTVWLSNLTKIPTLKIKKEKM